MSRALAFVIGTYLVCCVPAFLASGIIVGGQRSIADVGALRDVLTATALVALVIWGALAVAWGAILLIVWAIDA